MYFMAFGSTPPSAEKVSLLGCTSGGLYQRYLLWLIPFIGRLIDPDNLSIYFMVLRKSANVTHSCGTNNLLLGTISSD